MRKLLFVLVTLPFFICGLSQNLPRILLTNDDGIEAPGYTKVTRVTLWTLDRGVIPQIDRSRVFARH